MRGEVHWSGALTCNGDQAANCLLPLERRHTARINEFACLTAPEGVHSRAPPGIRVMPGTPSRFLLCCTRGVRLNSLIRPVQFLRGRDTVDKRFPQVGGGTGMHTVALRWGGRVVGATCREPFPPRAALRNTRRNLLIGFGIGVGVVCLGGGTRRRHRLSAQPEVLGRSRYQPWSATGRAPSRRR